MTRIERTLHRIVDRIVGDRLADMICRTVGCSSPLSHWRQWCGYEICEWIQLTPEEIASNRRHRRLPPIND